MSNNQAAKWSVSENEYSFYSESKFSLRVYGVKIINLIGKNTCESLFYLLAFYTFTMTLRLERKVVKLSFRLL